MGDVQCRKFLITINNPDNLGLTKEVILQKLATLSLAYYCFAYEKGNTLHIHIFLYSLSPIRFSTIQRKFEGGHIDACRGTCKENRDYIRKEGKYLNSDKSETVIDGTFVEWGKLPEETDEKKGTRELVLQKIKDGNSVVEIINEFPSEMYKVNDIEILAMEYRFHKYKREYRQIDVMYIYGKSGTGKTRFIYQNEDIEDIYRLTNYPSSGIKFDEYVGQNVIVFEEFGSQIPLKDLLSYLDIYPLYLPARYHNRIACYTKVYITSNEPIEEQYKNEQEKRPESFNALLRRVNRIIEMKEGGLINYVKNDEPKEIINRKEGKDE